MHAVGGGAGQAARRLWTRVARCLLGPARSASPLWLQPERKAPLAWAPGPPTRRSFAGCRDPRPGCTSALSPGTWKVSFPHHSSRGLPGFRGPRVGRAGVQRRVFGSVFGGALQASICVEDGAPKQPSLRGWKDPTELETGAPTELGGAGRTGEERRGRCAEAAQLRGMEGKQIRENQGTQKKE